jgi:glutathione peroxidase
MHIYDIPFKKADGTETTLAEFRGKVLLIVNVASECGFTGQYAGLQALYEKYKDRGLVVLGFPCNQFMNQEPDDDAAIQAFCSRKFSVTFPVFAKIDVNGENAHPLYQHLKKERRGTLGTSFIKWNFAKFLVDREGNVVKRLGTATGPSSIEAHIEKLLG